MSPRVGVAIPAAGSGRRMGGVRKPFLELRGEPVLIHALRPFLARTDVVAVAVALAAADAAADAEDPPGWLLALDDRICVVAGGATRSESVRAAVAALPEGCDLVAVHDAARPLVSAALVDRCFAIAATGVGAVAGCPAVDTLKEVDDGDRVTATADRSRFWQAHTPQVFPADLLRRAHRGRGEATDDAALVERLGETVRMVDGGRWNLKVTRPEDLSVAEALLDARAAEATTP